MCYVQARPLVETPNVRQNSSRVPPKEDQSYVRRLFYGDIMHNQLFPFPVALDEEARETLQVLSEPVAKFFKESVDSVKIDLEHEYVPIAVLSSCTCTCTQSFRNVDLQDTQSNYGWLERNGTFRSSDSSRIWWSWVE